jgi:AmmeMemoRadiSam system protein B
MIREAAVAGSWYPGDPEALAAEVESCFANVETTTVPRGRLIGLVSPHAGLRYSGAVAAHAYRLLAGREDVTAVLVGPSHRYAYEGVAVWPEGAFATPFGEAPVDSPLAAALLAADPDRILKGQRPHLEEHSLEMQLPFLQRQVRGLRIVPCLMGHQTREVVDALAAALTSVLSESGGDVILVASSDLSHYETAPVANRKDALVVDDVARFDPERLMARLEKDPGHACGGGPMVAVMKAAKALGATRSTILRYADSGDAGERDKSRVVGYLAAAFTA